MSNPFLTNNSLKKFVEDSNISKEKKDLLLGKVEQMDEEERKGLFETLIDIVLLDVEEQEAIRKIEKYFQTPAKAQA